MEEIYDVYEESRRELNEVSKGSIDVSVFDCSIPGSSVPA